MIKSKKQSLIVIGVFTLVLMLVTTTYAFFNYTRTGTANVIKTGRISFSTNQTDTINLTNVFPIDKTTIGTDTTNTDEVVISITGDTTYTEGLEYLVTAVDVNNTIGLGNNQKSVPISISVSASNLGEEDEEYFDNRENTNNNLYSILANDVVVENRRVAVGYIKSGATGVNGTLTIKAYLDKDKIAISDTYDGTENDNMGTTTEWVDNRTVLTTAEWNALQTDGVSFKIKVEANEGIWVEEVRSINAMNTFPTEIFGTYDSRTDVTKNIKEVYFNKMGATRMQNAYDAATIKVDLTYNNEGKVLAWLETNPDDNTKYNLIVASDGDTYLPSNCTSMFNGWSNVEVIEFNNVSTEYVTNMAAMFMNCGSLKSIDLSNMGSDNLSNNGFNVIFSGCAEITSISMNNFNLGNVTNLSEMFSNLTKLSNINLLNINTTNVTSMTGLFENCSSITDLNLSSFDFSNLNYSGDATSRIFNGCVNLKVLDISGTLIFGGKMPLLFNDLPELSTIYVSSGFSMSNQLDMVPIFSDCPSLVGGNGTTFDSTKTDKTYAIIDGTNGQPGYFTDIADKPTS